MYFSITEAYYTYVISDINSIHDFGFCIVYFKDIIEQNSYKLLTYSSCAHTQLYYSFAVYECTYVDFMKNHKLRFPAKWYKCIFYLDWALYIYMMFVIIIFEIWLYIFSEKIIRM
ncbi:hypothetical protein V1478_012061 [Vespula squamosa]|uniref:Uncharacterized protein n=1 Tax=Vespula squamosa TaxID=30214 RepID=A0ABD2ACD3_VESSQ